MKKRLVVLLSLAIALTAAPAALASHCKICTELRQECRPILNYGFSVCSWNPWDGCVLEQACGSHFAPSQPLAAEFTVASVERLDEPQQPNQAATLVAANDTDPSAND